LTKSLRKTPDGGGGGAGPPVLSACCRARIGAITGSNTRAAASISSIGVWKLCRAACSAACHAYSGARAQLVATRSGGRGVLCTDHDRGQRAAGSRRRARRRREEHGSNLPHGLFVVDPSCVDSCHVNSRLFVVLQQHGNPFLSNSARARSCSAHAAARRRGRGE
jgi:hypothetical protein